MGCLDDSRGKKRCAVHQGTVVVVADKVILGGGLVTRLGSVDDLDVHRVVGVVEVDDQNVKHQHSRRGDDATWTDHTQLFNLCSNSVLH